jgi:hypothetical protein
LRSFQEFSRISWRRPRPKLGCGAKERRRRRRRRTVCILIFAVMYVIMLGKNIYCGLFENRTLRRIFGPKREEMTGGWRRQYDDELRNLYPSPNIVKVIMSRTLKMAGHLARVGHEKCLQNFGRKT